MPVVVILPLVQNKVLLRLRDEKDWIIFAGKWGFFSGSIQENEVPQQAAARELNEELGIQAELEYFSYDEIKELDGLPAFAYRFPLQNEVSKLQIFEEFSRKKELSYD